MAKSHPVYYAGKTRDGDPISFALNGTTINKLKAYVPALCGSTDGFPMHGSDPFDPPGSFPLSKTTKVTAKRHNAIWNTSDVTKNFVVSFKRGAGGIITGKLHSDFSFLMILTRTRSARGRPCAPATRRSRSSCRRSADAVADRATAPPGPRRGPGPRELEVLERQPPRLLDVTEQRERSCPERPPRRPDRVCVGGGGSARAGV
jgi:hypothetical protein